MSAEPLHRERPATSTAWAAAGVRHALLMRVLPSLRHDLLGLVSIVRMSTAILARQLDRTPLDMATCQSRVQALDGHLAAVVHGMRSLSAWDPSTALLDPPVDAGQLLVVCADLLRPPMVLEHSQLVVAPEPAAGCLVPAAPFAYATLGLLCHCHEQQAEPARLTASLDAAARCVRIDIEALDAPPDAPQRSVLGAEPSARPPIDAAALRCLLDDQGWQLTLTADSAIAHWPDGR